MQRVLVVLATLLMLYLTCSGVLSLLRQSGRIPFLSGFPATRSRAYLWSMAEIWTITLLMLLVAVGFH